MFLSSQLFAQHYIAGIFSQRQGGISPPPFDSLNLGLGLGDSDTNVQQNLKLLCKAADIPIPHRSQQVHGSKHLLCHGEGLQHHQAADILITHSAGTAVAVRTADCLPILLVDPVSAIAAAVHAGWRGTVENAATTAIRQMQQLGANPEHMLASLGPAIAQDCFEVDTDTAEQLSRAHPQAADCIRYEQNKACVDLQAINVLQLQSAGLLHEHIELFPHCTVCLEKQFFSYRRDGMHTGRQLAIVALPMSL